ncbi:MAG: hypothetical protein SFU57_00220 [Gemmatimonadales bacterium]|nr:hypothetical protein [Gemmatimonadales bacterium]
MTVEAYHPDHERTTPAPITFTVCLGDSALGLVPGDRLTWDPTQPRGERVTLTRKITLHEGQIDRLQLRSAIVPPAFNILASRQAMVAALLRDAGMP